MRFFPIALSLVLFPTAVLADGARALAPILEPKPNAKACWRRHYDDDHMRAHPHQKVTDMTLMLLVQAYEASDAKPGQVVYNFAVNVKRRSDKKALSSSGECAGDEKARCKVECEGGGFILEQVRDGDGVLLKLTEGMALENDCNGAPGTRLAPGSDDKAFRLDPAPDDACRALEKFLLPG